MTSTTKFGSVCTHLFRRGDESVGREVGAGEDEVVLLGGERLPEHDGVDPGDLAGAGGQLRHGLDVAELVRGSALRRRLLAVGRAHDGGWRRRLASRGGRGSEIRAGGGRAAAMATGGVFLINGDDRSSVLPAQSSC